jgi:hypothetical protein
MNSPNCLKMRTGNPSVDQQIPFGLSSELAGSADTQLDSWKEIAAYLKRSVRCVQRWERNEAMPVHRHDHDRAASVYAFRAEIDSWRNSRSLVEVRDAECPSPALSGDSCKGKDAAKLLQPGLPAFLRAVRRSAIRSARKETNNHAVVLIFVLKL